MWNSVNDIWLDRNTEMPVVSEVLLSGLSLVLKLMMNGLHPGHLGSAAEGLSNLSTSCLVQSAVQCVFE